MEKLDQILEELQTKGSNKQDLMTIREYLKKVIMKEQDIDSAFHDLANRINQYTTTFFHEKSQDGIDLMTGFASSIYIPSFDNSGEINLMLTGGVTSRTNHNQKVNENTVFDIASITKLFTCILTLKLAELHIIDLDETIVMATSEFQGLEDFTFRDLLRLHGEIKTKGNIASAQTPEEANQILHTAYLSSKNRIENKYTDLGAIIIGKALEKISSKLTGINLTLQDLFEHFIFQKAHMIHTQFNPTHTNISGNGGYSNHVHDPKSHHLNGIAGSAGVFTTCQDLNQFAKELYSVNHMDKTTLESIINKDNLKKLGEITFPNSTQAQKGNLGIYVKHPLGLQKTYTPSLFSKDSFSYEGWTRAVAAFDPNNLIHYNFLVNAIYESDNKKLIFNDKPVGFAKAWDDYYTAVSNDIFCMMILKRYQNQWKEKAVQFQKKYTIQ